jgi:hypothetical protein
MKTGLITAVILALVAGVGTRLSMTATPPLICTPALCTVTVSRSVAIFTAVDHDTALVATGNTLLVTAPGTTFKPPGVEFASQSKITCTPDNPANPTLYTCPIAAATPKGVALKYTVTLSGAFANDPYVVNN